MSTKNIPSAEEIALATPDQIIHIIGNLQGFDKKSRDELQRIITNGGLYKRRYERMLADFFAEEFEEYLLDLDPTLSLEERIARGNYDYVNPDITSANFRLTKTGRRKIVLYDPKGNNVSSEEMVWRMEQNGDRPAALDDALELGYKYPERQHKNAISFLDKDTSWRDHYGSLRVPVLIGWYGSRTLKLGWFDDGWDSVYRFAAVREF